MAGKAQTRPCLLLCLHKLSEFEATVIQSERTGAFFSSVL